ncbi:uncharacterized protein BO87DRAFT_441517 [Aspergillus neoniger CBS 115656]|uniref:Protein kinase domain-containing protein n=1 Tax=Aspergillus neoniger (strain CBS 115656) TaxID=1448310 RepID=A0A318YVY2_ASPNB|nr:hypothetical protein BO87DRAFT_441517 [Aspergillus neoniger CBS 115656]PYH32028.1 hypothetical protein BO87DRAFT_441517 [Aspergillus neoniger CBS 115656]
MLNLSDLGFIRCVKESQTSSVFQVSLQGRLCLMKVSVAYVRLKERGLCQQGIVPDFYGVIDQLDPMQWQPHLNKFLKDKHRPNAILLEFFPHLKQIGLETYTEDRAAALLSIIQQIHEAGICHCDPYPRNIMVQPETDRVLWIDFDRAQTVSDESITDRHHSWMEDDTLMTAELLDFLAFLVSFCRQYLLPPDLRGR